MPDALALAAAIAQGQLTATQLVETTLQHIQQRDPELNCFTEVFFERARHQAQRLDQSRQNGDPLGPLAGVPFGVKNLFDVQGYPTLAGSRINRDLPCAQSDAVVIQRLQAAGAILVGSQNMDEYAYGFTTENHHYGPTHNPHDPSRSAGGSSGGSAAAVAAGFVPFSLGSDTNGSVRVPAALCGIYGLKPTFGLIPRTGMFPFVHSLDHVGIFTRSIRDLHLLLGILTNQHPEPLPTAPPELRLGILGGYFRQNAWDEALAAVDHLAQALGIQQSYELPHADIARAAAFVITASEGGSLHQDRLRQRPQDFDPATRDRLLAGSLVPAAWIDRAHRFRAWFRAEVQKLWQEVDLLLAPATPYPAPLLGQNTITVHGEEVLVRPNLGIFTQPISFIGLPVLTYPVWLGALPLGVQLIAPPHREHTLLHLAQHLENLLKK